MWRAALPLTYAASLLQGIWVGDPWSAHLGDVAALARGICGMRRGLGAGVSVGVGEQMC